MQQQLRLLTRNGPVARSVHGYLVRGVNNADTCVLDVHVGLRRAVENSVARCCKTDPHSTRRQVWGGRAVGKENNKSIGLVRGLDPGVVSCEVRGDEQFEKAKHTAQAHRDLCIGCRFETVAHRDDESELLWFRK